MAKGKLRRRAATKGTTRRRGRKRRKQMGSVDEQCVYHNGYLDGFAEGVKRATA